MHDEKYIGLSAYGFMNATGASFNYVEAIMERSRAEKMAAEISAKVKALQASGQLAPIKESKSQADKDTPELKMKRRIALEKLKTFTC
jgi:chaperone required for assembly of F1-ATPase